MKFLRQLRLIAEWLFDWYVLPVWEALFARGKDAGQEKDPAAEDKPGQAGR